MHGKAIISSCLVAAACVLSPMKTDACTNVLVTRGASADGSVLVSYAADSHTLFGELYYQKASDWKPGTMRKVYDWDSGRYLGEIPQIAHTYQRVGNMNEHQLIVAETTFGGREELWGENGTVDYGSLIYIALERCRTAREAIRTIADLTRDFGYFSEGESLSIADKDEVWVMEIIGKGASEKGAVWVARRVPDGYITCHANQARITTFPLDDPENCLYSEDVITFARKKGYFNGRDEEFSFCDAYAPLEFGSMRGCEARVWSAFNILGDGKFTYADGNGREITTEAGYYIDYAMGYDQSKRIPLFIKPSRKIGVKDVADVMRDHYEGTPMDMTQDIGAGGNALPYRWRPMGFEYGGKSYTNERAIATQQTGFWFVGQSRADLPDEIGGIIWFGTDDAATSYVTPIYICTTEVPECFREGNGDILTYSATASFWMNNRISNACYKMYNQMAPFVRAEIDSFENTQIARVRETDAAALRLYKGDGKEKKLRQYLTDYSVGTAQEQFARWTALEQKLLIKFIDGNVKKQEADGSFSHSQYTEKFPDSVEQPGYTEYWKEAVAHFHGKTVEEK